MNNGKTASNKKDYLFKELEEAIKHFDKESRKHKKWFRIWRYTAFAFTAFSTILASLAIAIPDENYKILINLAIVVTTALVGTVTSIEGLRKHDLLWIHERLIYHNLLDLDRKTKFELSENSPDLSIVKESFDEMQRILRSSRDHWNQIVAIQEDATERNDTHDE